MYQNFEDDTDSAKSNARVEALREAMQRIGIDAYLVPRADEYQGEYVPAAAERLKWISAFSGSAGMAAIGAKRAAVFVDGRYTVQAKTQIDTKLFEVRPLSPSSLIEWLADAIPDKSSVGIDPRLMTIRQFASLKSQLAANSITLKTVSKNLIDALWAREGNRPEPPAGEIIIQPLDYAGQPPKEKIASLQAVMRKDDQDAMVLTQPDSICWLFNIRGSDVAHNPVVLANAILPRLGKPILFVSQQRLTKPVRAHLKSIAAVRDPSELATQLAILKSEKKRVRLDPASASVWFENKLRKRAIVPGPDPCTRLKAIKNDAEVAGSRAAHIRDGIAVSRFLAWLDETATSQTLDEITAVEKLEGFRAETGKLREISFDTIAGSGPNGAIVHYRVSTKTNRQLKRGELFLVDSGAQYQDGTTDITRTIAIGTPTAEMCDRFTRVLQGHIAVATARFPVGSRGVDLDPFARRALWQAGLDYDHGTGHGVGSYLSVHEGPASISRAGMVPLEPGMILSNEPGYYKEGAYGIRIENLVLVTPPAIPKGGDRPMLGFESLTLAPIDRRLIVTKLLSETERNWLDSYHAGVAKALAPELDPATRKWLKAACAPL